MCVDQWAARQASAGTRRNIRLCSTDPWEPRWTGRATLQKGRSIVYDRVLIQGRPIVLLRSCDGAQGDHRDREGACIPVEQVDDVAVRRCHLLQQARGDLLSPRSQRRAARHEHLLHREPRTVAVTEGEHPVKAAAGCSPGRLIGAYRGRWLGPGRSAPITQLCRAPCSSGESGPPVGVPG